MREFFNSPQGKLAAVALVVIALVLAFFSFRSSMGNDAASISADRMFIDAKTGKAFEHVIRIGDVIPVKAPSGGNTGYPAEQCFWTADGKIKKTPTAVLVNARLGKPGPTFCPECGRLVTPHNPPPVEGHPPPTKEEYEKRQANRRSSDHGDERQ